MRISATQPR